MPLFVTNPETRPKKVTGLLFGWQLLLWRTIWNCGKRWRNCKKTAISRRIYFMLFSLNWTFYNYMIWDHFFSQKYSLIYALETLLCNFVFVMESLKYYKSKVGNKRFKKSNSAILVFGGCGGSIIRYLHYSTNKVPTYIREIIF